MFEKNLGTHCTVVEGTIVRVQTGSVDLRKLRLQNGVDGWGTGYHDGMMEKMKGDTKRIIYKFMYSIRLRFCVDFWCLKVAMRLGWG